MHKFSREVPLSVLACGRSCGSGLVFFLFVRFFFFFLSATFVCVGLTGGACGGPWPSIVIHTVGSKSYQYNLNGKETAGLDCPCFTMLESWHLACVWGPKLQFSHFPRSSLWLLKGRVRWIIQRMYSKWFLYILFMLYFFIIKKTHVPVPLLCPTSTLCGSALLFHVSLLSDWSTLFSSFLPSLLPSLTSPLRLYCYCFLFFSPSPLSLRQTSPFLPSFPSPRRSPIPLCVALICVIASFLPTAHPPLCKWERGEQRGECHAGPREQGLNEATLNEFTAFHRAALFHVAAQHLGRCPTEAPPRPPPPMSVGRSLIPVCLTPL